VFGWADGSFAEYAIAPEDQLAAKPANLGFEQAAVVPISGFAAEVTGVASVDQADLVRSLGADQVVDYTREDVTDGTRHWP
jgi:NADPH:quinone reductase-like Zn-dependent oxidoreductase